MIQAEEHDDELSLHLYRVLAKCFKSVHEHAAIGSKMEGFNPTAFAVMEVLYCRGPQSIQRIGSGILLQSGNVTYVVDKLEQRGLIRREPCLNDRRVIYASLTPAGEELMKAVYPKYTAFIQRAFCGLNSDEKLELIELLKKLGRQAERLVPAIRK